MAGLIQVIRLEEQQKFIRLDFRLFQYPGQGGALYGIVRRNGQFQGAIRQVFLEPDVAPLLPNHDPSVSPESIHDFP